MVLAQVVSFRCKPRTDWFWVAFEILSPRALAVAAVPTRLASMEQDDRAGLHRTRLHLSFRPWLVHYYGGAKRNGPEQWQRDKNQRLRRV